MTDTSTDPGAGLSVDAALNLSLSLGRLADEMAADREQRKLDNRRRQRLMPTDRPQVASGVAATGANLFLFLSGPDLGFFWEVRNIVVGGTLITSAPAGTAYVMIGPGGAGSDLSLFNMRDNAILAFPQVAYYGTRQLIVNQNQDLWVVIVGGTNGVTYSVQAICMQYPIETYEETMEL
jgi:hypothetical protein